MLLKMSYKLIFTLFLASNLIFTSKVDELAKRLRVTVTSVARVTARDDDVIVLPLERNYGKRSAIVETSFLYCLQDFSCSIDLYNSMES